jgi:SAM-dependent methyltransferase
MQLKILDILACPKCFEDLTCLPKEMHGDQEVVSGNLKCKNCRCTYPIQSSIPRFVPAVNYAASFGFQWNRFKFEQIDAFASEKLSANRFYAETGWRQDELNEKWILDLGCGAGRFLDIAAKSTAEVVGVDISNAVDACAVTLAGRKNVHLVQASVYELPFKPGVFDAAYSIGVIQHTPAPARAIAALPRLLKKNGKIALTVYERKPWTLLNVKYLIRPLTKRIPKKALLFLINVSMPVFYPLTAILFRIPWVGGFFKFVIPVADYPRAPGLSLKQRYRCVILDTFDMLAPQFDYPQTQKEVEDALSGAGVVNIERLKIAGLSIVGQKK